MAKKKITLHKKTRFERVIFGRVVKTAFFVSNIQIFELSSHFEREFFSRVVKTEFYVCRGTFWEVKKNLKMFTQNWQPQEKEINQLREFFS